jgi:hypothetical protein
MLQQQTANGGRADKLCSGGVPRPAEGVAERARALPTGSATEYFGNFVELSWGLCRKHLDPLRLVALKMALQNLKHTSRMLQSGFRSVSLHLGPGKVGGTLGVRFGDTMRFLFLVFKYLRTATSALRIGLYLLATR